MTQDRSDQAPGMDERLWDPAAIPAATVVVVRPAAAGPEVLLVRRDRALSFAGGMWVFPGGRIDPADHRAPEGAAVADPVDLEVAARRAAVREAAEEAGLVLDEPSLVRWSHWTPPPESPKRFSTAFFVTALPDDAGDVVVDDGEIREHRWARPIDVLDERDRGGVGLSPPTFITLTQLARHADVDSLLAAANERPVEHFWTRICVDGEEVVALYHGDHGYETGVVSNDGPRHRLRMAARWTYERST